MTTCRALCRWPSMFSPLPRRSSAVWASSQPQMRCRVARVETPAHASTLSHVDALQRSSMHIPTQADAPRACGSCIKVHNLLELQASEVQGRLLCHARDELLDAAWTVVQHRTKRGTRPVVSRASLICMPCVHA
jgi:hypothetical protein